MSEVAQQAGPTMSQPKPDPVCVTGATGYIASFIVRELLSKGYTVHATVRALSNESKVSSVRSLDPTGEKLLFFEMDMTKPDTFAPALSGCKALIHTATPIYFAPYGREPFGTEEEAVEHQIKPAVDGTQALLAAASVAGVKTVVLTSSTAAMVTTAEPADVLDESAWSDEAYARSRVLVDSAGAYRLAKTQQELTAWAITRASGMRMVAINPGYVSGPSITPHANVCERLFVNLCRGEGIMSKGCRKGTVPDACMALVDVRDVAATHVRALDGEMSGRYLLLTEDVHCVDIVEVLRGLDSRFTELKTVSIDSVDGERHAVTKKFDNRKAKGIGVCNIPWEDTVRACGEAILARGILDEIS